MLKRSAAGLKSFVPTHVRVQTASRSASAAPAPAAPTASSRASAAPTLVPPACPNMQEAEATPVASMAGSARAGGYASLTHQSVPDGGVWVSGEGWKCEPTRSQHPRPQGGAPLPQLQHGHGPATCNPPPPPPVHGFVHPPPPPPAFTPPLQPRLAPVPGGNLSMPACQPHAQVVQAGYARPPPSRQATRQMLLQVGTDGVLLCDSAHGRPFLSTGVELFNNKPTQFIEICTFGMRPNVSTQGHRDVHISLEWDSKSAFPPALDRSGYPQSGDFGHPGRAMMTLHVPSEVLVPMGEDSGLACITEQHSVKLFLSGVANATLRMVRP